MISIIFYMHHKCFKEWEQVTTNTYYESPFSNMLPFISAHEWKSIQHRKKLHLSRDMESRTKLTIFSPLWLRTKEKGKNLEWIWIIFFVIKFPNISIKFFQHCVILFFIWRKLFCYAQWIFISLQEEWYFSIICNPWTIEWKIIEKQKTNYHSKWQWNPQNYSKSNFFFLLKSLVFLFNNLIVVIYFIQKWNCI